MGMQFLRHSQRVSTGSTDDGGPAGTRWEQLHEVAAVNVAEGVAKGVCERVAVRVKADADWLAVAVAVATTERDGALENEARPDLELEGDELGERDDAPERETVAVAEKLYCVIAADLVAALDSLAAAVADPVLDDVLERLADAVDTLVGPLAADGAALEEHTTAHVGHTLRRRSPGEAPTAAGVASAVGVGTSSGTIDVPESIATLHSSPRCSVGQSMIATLAAPSVSAVERGRFGVLWG